MFLHKFFALLPLKNTKNRRFLENIKKTHFGVSFLTLKMEHFLIKSLPGTPKEPPKTTQDPPKSLRGRFLSLRGRFRRSPGSIWEPPGPIWEPPGSIFEPPGADLGPILHKSGHKAQNVKKNRSGMDP